MFGEGKATKENMSIFLVHLTCNLFTHFFVDDLLLETGDVELKRDQLVTL